MTLHYGVDYYPEHWPEATWARDAELMRAAGFTVVRIAEFAWTKLEPREGEFDWGWLDRAIETLHTAGIAVVLGTPTATPPRWLTLAHPAVLFVDATGHTASPISRRFVCLGNETFRDHTTRIVWAMAERYAKHPAIIGWQIDNEFGCHDTTRCYCDDCQRRFRDWLRARYGTLDALNEAWGTVFWSHTFTAWEQILPPLPTPTYWNPSHDLDWRRFSSQTTVSYQQEQIDLIRQAAPSHWVTHNFMAFYDGLDYTDLARGLDFVSWDNYVPEGTTPAISARYHDEMRGYKHRPFWVIESPIAQVNWTRYNADLRRGEGRLRSWQAIGHGADAIFYFQWRGFRGGAEQFHSAVLGADGVPRRLYREAEQLGRELAALGPQLMGSEVKAEVAIVTTRDTYWAAQIQPHTELLRDPARWIAPWHDALYRRNIAVEYCLPTDDLSGYKLVIAPSLFLVSPAEVTQLRAFVEAGGTLIIGARSGVKAPSNVVVTEPLPGLLRTLAGVEVTEWAALPPNATKTIVGNGHDLSGELTVQTWCESLELHGATAVAVYDGGESSGEIAISKHQVGRGVVWYCGVLDDDLSALLIEQQRAALDISAALATPSGVEACLRRGADADFLILMNHGTQPAHVELPAGAETLLGPSDADGRVTIAPVDVQVYRLAR